MIVVDAAPLIYLSKIGRLELLRKLYGKIVIPQGVWDEVVTEAQGRPGAGELERGVREGWIRVEKALPLKSLLAERLEPADAEAVGLAKKIGGPLLTNDRVLVMIARTSGIEAKWLTQAIVEASRKGTIRPVEARSLLRDLVRAGLRIRSEVLAEAIHLIGEKETNRS